MIGADNGGAGVDALITIIVQQMKHTPQEQLLRKLSHAIKLTFKNEAFTERPDQKEKQRQPKRNQFKGPRTILGLPLTLQYNNHAVHQPQVCIHQQ